MSSEIKKTRSEYHHVKKRNLFKTLLYKVLQPMINFFVYLSDHLVIFSVTDKLFSL